MKKNILTMLICVVLLGGLLGAYYALSYKNSRPDENAETTPVDKTTKLIDKTAKDLESASFTSKNGTLTLLPVVEKAETEGAEDKLTWTVQGYEDIPLNTTKLADMARSVYQVLSVETVLDSVEDLSEYGLNPPAATGTGKFTDGTSKTLMIGKKTPAQDYYYVMVENDPALYLLYTNVGDRLFYGMKDIVDMTVPEIDFNTINYIYYNVKGGPEVEFDYNGTKEQKESDLEKFGGVLLTMMKPYEGREMYSSNFQTYIMDKTGAITFDELADPDGKELAKYGLDEPSLELHLMDIENELHILVGDEADDEHVYVKFFDRPQIYLAKAKQFSPYYDTNVLKFIDRFVMLINIETCERINISGQGREYDIQLNHEILPPEEDEEEGTAIIKPTVNKQEVKDKMFRKYYQYLIGLSYDNEIPVTEVSGTPEMTVTYYLNTTAKPIVCKYYNYPENDNFYVVQKDDYDAQFVVNKRSVEVMYQAMDDLLAGTLNQ